MSKQDFMIQHLRPGEGYAGLLFGGNGVPDVHMFLLPGEVIGVTWDEAKAWAEKVEGTPPCRSTSCAWPQCTQRQQENGGARSRFGLA